MTLEQAHDLLDLLLDKADQPYFTDDEKNQFLDQAIMSFINFHYRTYDQEQVSRDALSFFFHVSSLQHSVTGVRNLPEGYVHLIHFEIGNNASELKSAKILGSKDYLDFRLSSDPFNKASVDNPICFVRATGNPETEDFANQIHFAPTTPLEWPETEIGLGPASRYYCIRFRPHTTVFNDTEVVNVGTGLTHAPLAEIYQREIIDIAVRKMTGNIESDNIQYQQIEAEQSKSI